MYSLVNKVRQINPLVLHYTNDVTINDCANTTLAIGASPLMSFSYEEVEDLVGIASCVVINIGTMNSDNLDLYVLAGKAANKLKKRLVLDPVGVFASKARQELVKKLLNEVRFDVVKGNVDEIKFIGGFDVKGKGVDSFDDGGDYTEVIKRVAKKLECVVASTGKIDIVTNGTNTYKIENGTKKLKSVTGTGCMTASLIGSYISCTDDILQGAAMGVLTMSLSGELADCDNPPIGTFKVELMNQIYSINEETFCNNSKIELV